MESKNRLLAWYPCDQIPGSNNIQCWSCPYPNFAESDFDEYFDHMAYRKPGHQILESSTPYYTHLD